MILTRMIDINKMLKLSQGHKVNGQGQICKFVKNVFRLYVLKQRLNIDEVYTHDKYWLVVEVDSRSRSQGQRLSQLCKCVKKT